MWEKIMGVIFSFCAVQYHMTLSWDHWSKVMYLVELQRIEEVKQFAVLLAVLQLGVVLLQAVECEFGLIVHKYFHWLQEEKSKIQ